MFQLETFSNIYICFTCALSKTVNGTTWRNTFYFSHIIWNLGNIGYYKIQIKKKCWVEQFLPQVAYWRASPRSKAYRLFYVVYKFDSIASSLMVVQRWILDSIPLVSTFAKCFVFLFSSVIFSFLPKLTWKAPKGGGQQHFTCFYPKNEFFKKLQHLSVFSSTRESSQHCNNWYLLSNRCFSSF